MWRATGDAVGCLRTLTVFALLMAPVYYMLRLLVRLARLAYGFDDGADEDPVGVCDACHNTVLEAGVDSCPYCGQPFRQ